MADSTPSYVAFCQTCGGMTACTVDDGTDPKGVAKFLAPIMRRGNRVERLTVNYVHEYKGEWCSCKRKRVKPRSEQMEVAL